MINLVFYKCINIYKKDFTDSCLHRNPKVPLLEDAFCPSSLSETRKKEKNFS